MTVWVVPAPVTARWAAILAAQYDPGGAPLLVAPVAGGRAVDVRRADGSPPSATEAACISGVVAAMAASVAAT